MSFTCNPTEIREVGRSMASSIISFLATLLAVGGVAASARSQSIRLDPPPGTLGYGFGGPAVALSDLNGDGIGDFAIGTAGRQDGDPRRGRVLLYSGRTWQVMRTLSSPLVSGDFAFGVAVASLPDIDNDGVGDIVVGEVGQTLGSLGYAYLFSGRTGDLLHTVTSGLMSAGVNYGYPVVSVPDVDGDGLADFAVGAPEDPPGGLVYVYSSQTAALLRTLTSPFPASGGRLGASLVGAPDMNFDGRGEILATAFEPRQPDQPERGVLYYFSGATGEASMRLPYYGPAASLPDVDGDGVPDVIVGGNTVGNGRGTVWIISGSTGEQIYSLDAPSPPGVFARFGYAVAGVKDVDGDDRGDLLVGAVNETTPEFPVLYGPGAAYLISGATGTILKRFDSGSPLRNGHFGSSVTFIPDSNGDGLPEIAISAEYEPHVYVFLSCSADWNFSGAVDAADFFDFLEAYFAGRADFNHDAKTNSQDFFDYLNAFFAGCP
jgi:hypothetical protein